MKRENPVIQPTPSFHLQHIRRGQPRVCAFFCWAACCLLVLPVCLRADQLEMQNGDRYFGKVLSLTTNTVTLKSEVLGTVKLPREQVLSMNFGSAKATNAPAPAVAVNGQFRAPRRTATNTTSDLSAAVRQLGTNSSLIDQVQSQFLADSGPEAKNKFNELLGGLQSGALTINDLYAQAKTAADQLRAVRQGLGDEAGVAIDGYLSILDSFLKEGASSISASASAASPKSKTVAKQAEDE